MKKNVLYLFFFLSTIVHAHALTDTQPTFLVGSKEHYEMQGYSRYALAQDMNETAIELANHPWSVDRKSFATFKNFNKAYWMKFKLKNSTNTFQTYYFKSERQFIYRIEFFVLKKRQVIAYQRDGLIVENKERQFNSNHMLFPIHFAPQEELEVYFKILNYNKVNVPFSLVSKSYLINFYQTYSMVEGILFGAMLLLLLYNLFLYFFVRLRVYLYYVLYNFSIILYFMGFFGFMERYCPDWVDVYQVSGGLIFITLTLFLEKILNIKKELPHLKLPLHVVIGSFIFLSFAYAWFLEKENFFYVQLFFNLFCLWVIIYIFFMIVVIYYLAFFKERLVAKLLALLWTVVAFWALLIPLVYLKLFEFSFSVDYIVQAIIVFEFLCLALLLAYRIKLIEKEKMRQQELLVQQNKLASMGEMISTIAQEWRKPLYKINGMVLDIEIDFSNQTLTKKRFNHYLNGIEEITAYLSQTIHEFMRFFNTTKRLETFTATSILKQSQKLFVMAETKSIHIDYNDVHIEMIGYQSELIQSFLLVFQYIMENSTHSNRMSTISIDITSCESEVCFVIKEQGSKMPPKGHMDSKIDTNNRSLYILKMIVEEHMNGNIHLYNGKEGVVFELMIPKILNIN